MKKFLTVLAAGYAIGVGLLMKKRKDEGKSKLADDVSKTTLENVVDEIVDLHKTAFEDIKNFIHTNLTLIHSRIASLKWQMISNSMLKNG